ncbi:MAG TPA: hypothetical protein VFM80_08585 [Gracilimonas sp.]|uniref:hypothetical protein n=1 Tax=Gracilimonas sp. TaxID=1974203 RepID=UPI002D9B9872|nr:hypothetical protein [Gracilimonas sp.]
MDWNKRWLCLSNNRSDGLGAVRPECLKLNSEPDLTADSTAILSNPVKSRLIDELGPNCWQN